MWDYSTTAPGTIQFTSKLAIKMMFVLKLCMNGIKNVHRLGLCKSAAAASVSFVYPSSAAVPSVVVAPWSAVPTAAGHDEAAVLVAAAAPSVLSDAAPSAVVPAVAVAPSAVVLAAVAPCGVAPSVAVPVVAAAPSAAEQRTADLKQTNKTATIRDITVC